MGEVIALIRVMPDGTLTDKQMQSIIDEIKKRVRSPARLANIEVKEIAFGLRGLNVTVIVPDSEGGFDPVVEELSTIKKVESVEVTDVGRL
ncbi:MAG: elongation factor 1-beta [Candidatus Thermoplasmatota archaeon]